MEKESYAFMAIKFPNMRFKRNQPFKTRPKSRYFNNKEKALTRFSKGGFKIGIFNKSNIRSFQCNELGHCVTDCKKPMKKDKSYLELECKYEALLKKQSGRSFTS